MAEDSYNGTFTTDVTVQGTLRLMKSELDTTGWDEAKSNFEQTRSEISKAKQWLSSLMSKPAAHVLNITLGALLNGTNAVTRIHSISGSLGDFRNSIVAGIGAVGDSFLELDKLAKLNQFTVNAINAITDELKNPNIAGIPIHADVEKESQDVTVARNLYIRESAANKELVIDNTVPQLKTWRVSGYLMSNPGKYPASVQLLIKPDLLQQRSKLQDYIDARLPVLFKTHDNRFYKVLISHMDTEYTIQGLNALKIDLTLTEFKVLEISTASLVVDTANPGKPEV